MKISVIIVTYNPGADFLSNLKTIAAQYVDVVVVDNGSNPEFLAGARRFASSASSVTLIENGSNLGLAAAQNIGIRLALEKMRSQDSVQQDARAVSPPHPAASQRQVSRLAGGQNNEDWVILLDDDSLPDPGMADAMLEAWNSHSNKDKISILAPNFYDPNTAQKARFVVPWLGFLFRRVGFESPSKAQGAASRPRTALRWRRATQINQMTCLRQDSHAHRDGQQAFTGAKKNISPLTAIAAGSMIKASLFQQIGLMREDFFIDYVDNEFCLRARLKGHRILAVENARLRHTIGVKQDHSALGLTVTTSNHSPMRRYYIYRNRIRVWRMYGLKVPSFLIYDCLAAVYDLFRIAFLEKGKALKLKAILRGARDALSP